MQNLEFEKDSKLQIIDQFAFSNTNIKSIRIPSNVTIIGNYSFFGCKNLSQIEFESNSNVEISPDNENFKIYENKIIFGKSSIEQTNYSELVFCFRNVETFIIRNLFVHIHFQIVLYRSFNKFETLKLFNKQ